MTFETLQNAMYAAMKARDKMRKDVLSTLVANAKKMAIDKKEDRENISEETVDAVIMKEKKTLEEMVAGCPDTPERAALKQEYKDKLAIVTEYAPKLISDEAEIRKMIAESGIEIAKENRGKIMGLLKGKCDMKVANQVVGALLAKN